MLEITEVTDSEELNQGDAVLLEWTLPYDIPTADVTFKAEGIGKSAEISGADIQKTFVGPTPAFGGRDSWTYSAEMKLLSLVVEFELLAGGVARRTEKLNPAY